MSNRNGADRIGVAPPARITFSAKQAAAFAELLRGTLQTRQVNEDLALLPSHSATPA